MSGTVLTVLCVQKSGYWFVQCLDHNIAAEGSTLEEARENWAKLFESHLRVAEKLKQEPVHKYWGSSRKIYRVVKGKM